MGTTVNGIYLPGHLEQNWDDEVNNNLRRLSELAVNVKAYGAKGDGVQDDSSYVQAAIDAGQHIFFPTGTYKLSSSLTIPNHAMLFAGAGRDRTVLKPDAGVSAFNITAGRHGVVFRDMTFLGASNTAKGFSCGTASGSGDFQVWFEHVGFTTLAYAYDTNGNAHQTTGTRFYRCEFSDAPVRFNGTGAHNTMEFFWCRFSGMAQNVPALELTGAAGSSDVANVIRSCVFESNDRQAVKLTRQRLWAVDDSYFEANNTDAVASLPWVDMCTGTYNGTLKNPYMVADTSTVGVGSSDTTQHVDIAILNPLLVGASAPTIDYARLDSCTVLGSFTGMDSLASAFTFRGQNGGVYFTTNNAGYPMAKFRLSATGSPAAQPVQFLGQDGTTVLAAIRGNGAWQGAVVATASLPAAAAAMDGTILIEDNGTGDRNLIIYAGGQRFRIDGGANF